MGLKIVCSGYLVRYPVGGFSWHHFQYLAGFERMGHEVTYVEDFGWAKSCYDPTTDAMTPDPGYGLTFLTTLLAAHALESSWCYLAEDGTAYGMSRGELARRCRQCDVYVNVSDLNSTPELEQCRRRVLVDTDPVFTQIGARQSKGGVFPFDALFTYGENVHQPGCTMPTAGARWLPTRQPIVPDLWPVEAADPEAPFTTVTSWDPFGDQWYQGRVFGGKARTFEPFFSLPRDAGACLEMAVCFDHHHCDPEAVGRKLREGGWRVLDAADVTRTPQAYQRYLRRSRAEFSVAKHGYVETQCGWFSDRSSGYLASGRPVVVQDTGFSRWLPVGEGVLTFRTPEQARAAIAEVNRRYAFHCRAARAVVEEYFDARKVLARLLDDALSPAPDRQASPTGADP